jgi:hypothetical protein
MFMFVSYPWPVASAYDQLIQRQRLAALANADGNKDTIGQHGPNLEELVGWTGRDRLRFQWYRFRIAISGRRRRA